MPKAVFQVLCGAFAGPGSEVMVASFYGPGNSGVTDWAIFVWSNDQWALELGRHQAARFAAEGADIRETTDIFRPGDPRCCPSGGTRSRIWHWDGQQFVASPWKGEIKPRGFYSPLEPSRNLWCDMGDSSQFRGVKCQSETPPHGARLGVGGRVTVCQGRRGCVGCVCDEGRGQTLAYGRQITVGRFRCVSLRTGVRCTVLQSGSGFVISGKATTRIGP